MTTSARTWEQRYEDLHRTRVSGDPEFHEWLLAWAELEAEIYEHGTALLRAFQADTTNAAVKQERRKFLTERAPLLKERHDQSACTAIELAQKFTVPADWRHVFLYFEAVVQQARQPSGELEGQVDVLAGEIAALFAQLKFEVDGRQLDAHERSALAASTDREERYAAFVSSRDARQKIAPSVVEKYAESLKLRREVARRSGAPNVHRHMWTLLERTDYTPEQVRQFRDDVRGKLNPLLLEFRLRRRELLGVDRLRAWDLAADPYGSAASARYPSEADLMAQVVRSLSFTLPGLGEQVAALYSEGYLDLTPRPGKAARSYTDYLAHSRKPYVQMSLLPTPGSVQVLFHELGHVAQLTGVAPDSPFWHYFPGVEMREFVAQVFELWSLRQLSAFFDFNNEHLYHLRFYEQTLARISTQCMMDEFQEWFYTTDEDVTQARLEDVWRDISARYPTGVDREGLPSTEPLAYLSQQLVRRPLVGIEYALAWSWAFGFIANVEADAGQAFGQLGQAIALGSTRSLPELLKTAGVEFSLSAEQLDKLTLPMRRALSTL